MNTVLAGYGLVKKYGSTTALAGVDVDVRERDSLAIMGPSGSGKSTLLHTLAGIVRPDGGEVLLRGVRIDRLGENRLSALRRKRFGFVFQSGQLLPELPAEENVALPLMLEGMPADRPSSGPAAGSHRWASTASRTAGPVSSPAVRRSAWRSPGPWPSNRTWSSPTSRPAPWTRPPARRWSGC